MDLDLQIVPHTHLYQAFARGGVADDVGDRFGHDPVGGDFHGSGQRGQLLGYVHDHFESSVGLGGVRQAEGVFAQRGSTSRSICLAHRGTVPRR